MKISFAEPSLPRGGALVVGVLDGRELTPTAKQVDRATGGALGRAIKSGRFQGKLGQSLELAAPAGMKVSRVIAAGLGKASELNDLKLQNWGATALRQGNTAGDTDVALAVDTLDGAKMKPAEMAAAIAFGARLGSYRFDKYRTTEKADKKPTVKAFAVLVKGAAAARTAYGPLDKIGDGVFFTRDLVSEPANVIFPKSLAAQARQLTKLGVKVEVLGKAEMSKLGMGALLGVGQGSANESQLVVMQWKGKPKSKDKPLAILGKGVTFDTGGISIKPAAGMEDMKWDMGGSAVVIGLMRALAGRKAKVNVVGVVGLVENMPSGTAQRPGDVVRSMSGQTIEVINTDAEGRLVLADALWYTQNRFKPEFMIDLATLTGAIIIALADQHAGLFSNNDQLSERLIAAGKATGEPLWRFPLTDEYDKMINSDIADMQNVGGRGAGSITAAQFLQRFVNKVPWAHLDIAGMAWSKTDKPITPKGATAFGVRLLNRFLADNYEK